MVSRTAIVAYALPGLPFGAITIMCGMYLPRYYVDVVGVPLGLVGSIASFMQVWDAVTDPLIGAISDRCNTRWGRRRPIVLPGCIALAVVLVLLFTPPLGLSVEYIALYCCICFFFLTIFGTMARVPWMAWGLEITSEYDQKTVIVAVRELFYVGGAGLGAILPGIAGFLIEDYGTQLKCVAIGLAVLLVVGGASATYAVPGDRVPAEMAPGSSAAVEARGSDGVKRSPFIFRILSNRPAMVLFFTYLLFGIAVNVNGILFPFYITYIVESEATAIVLTGYIVMGVVGMPIWTWLSRRFEKWPVLAAAMLWQTLMIFIILVGVWSNDLVLYTCLIWSAGLSFGAVPAITFSMLSDVAEFEQLRSNGAKDEGKLIGLFDISRKFASSVGSAICFWLIDASGYEPGEFPQPLRVKQFIRMCYALAPAIFSAMAVLILVCFYPLNRAKHKETLDQLSELSERAKAEAAKKPSQAIECGDAVSQSRESTRADLDYGKSRCQSGADADASPALEECDVGDVKPRVHQKQACCDDQDSGVGKFRVVAL